MLWFKSIRVSKMGPRNTSRSRTCTHFNTETREVLWCQLCRHCWHRRLPLWLKPVSHCHDQHRVSRWRQSWCHDNARVSISFPFLYIVHYSQRTPGFHLSFTKNQQSGIFMWYWMDHNTSPGNQCIICNICSIVALFFNISCVILSNKLFLSNSGSVFTKYRK